MTDRFLILESFQFPSISSIFLHRRQAIHMLLHNCTNVLHQLSNKKKNDIASYAEKVIFFPGIVFVSVHTFSF